MPTAVAPIEILLVEDNPADARLVKEMLRETGEPIALIHAERLSQAIGYLRQQGFSAILLDLRLPDSEGLATFTRAHAEAPDTPIVVLTGLHDEDLAVKALREGAQDYLVKGQVDGRLLYHAIRYAIERHRVEEALVATQARLQQVLTSTPAVLYATAITPEGFSPTWVSDNILRVVGYEAREATTPTWWIDHLHPEDRPRVEREVRRLLTDGRLTTEYRFRRKDGSYAWVQDDSRLLLDAAGKPGEVFGAWLDVAERRQAEEALRESEQRFRELADNVREVFFVADPQTGQALYLSPAYEEVFGRSREHAYAERSHWLEAVHPEDRERLLAEILATVRGAEPGSELFRVVRPDGSVRWVRSRVSPVRDASGKVVRTVGIAEDVTELRRAQEQLVEAQKMEAIGRLAGGVAHDFNNLLTAITGHGELVLGALRAGEPLREDIEEMLKAAERAAALTKQLLAFSRRQVLEQRVVDLNALVADLDRLLRSLIGEDIELHTIPGEGLGAARADPGQLQQVILNLVVNARDAMPKGGKLTIETRNVELDTGSRTAHEPVKPGAYVMLAVSDTGAGMTEEVKTRVFEPFFTTKEVGRGTGLGLAMVYGVVRQSGGYVWVYSEPGTGTAFKIYLPRVDEQPVELAVRPSPAEPVGGTETVLLVEDEDVVRRLARIALAKRGYRVLEAANGAEALLLCEREQRPIEMLITDVVMPGMTGPELARQLASRRPQMKVLYVSGYPQRAMAQQRALPPGSAFLDKPFTLDGLTRRVRQMLDASIS